MTTATRLRALMCTGGPGSAHTAGWVGVCPTPPRGGCARTGARGAMHRTSVDAPSNGGTDEDDHRGAEAVVAAARAPRMIPPREDAREWQAEEVRRAVLHI